MDRRSCLWVLAILTLAGCGTGPGDSRFVSYTLDLTASSRDSTAERIRVMECTLTGSFQLSTPVPSSGTVRFAVFINRSLTEHRGNHREFTTADSAVSEAVLDYTGLDSEALQFTFGAGSYTVTPPAGVATPPNSNVYSADWTCGPDFPLAQDSTLNAYGYDSNLELPGFWRIQANLPVG